MNTVISNNRRPWVVCFIAVVLTVVTIVSASAAGAKEPAGAATADRNLSVTVFDRGLVPSSEGTYEENRWTRWVNETTGMNVTWVPVPRWTANDALNVMFAAGTAPDIIVEYVRTFFENWQQQGVIQPIDDYIDRYSIDYKGYLERHPGVRQQSTFPDGQQYFFATRRTATWNHNAWIRKDWLDNLGLSMPTTTDELLQVARAFTNDDPNGTGRRDTIGVTSRVGIWGQMFFAQEAWMVENGELRPNFLSDRYRDAMAYRKTFYDEGLMDREYVTDADQQRSRRLWITGVAGIYFAQTGADNYEEFMQNNPDAVMVPLPPVTGPHGRNGWFQEPEYHDHKAALNAGMSNPELAIEFIDWMIRDGWKTLRFGFEGVHHKLVDGQRVWIDLDVFQTELRYAAADMGFLKDYEDTPAGVLARAGDDPRQRRIAEMNVMGIENAMSVPYRRDIPFPPSHPEMTLFNAEWGPRQDEIYTQVITGGTQYTADWGIQQLRSEWERRGGRRIEQIAQQWFDENRAAFGY